MTGGFSESDSPEHKTHSIELLVLLLDFNLAFFRSGLDVPHVYLCYHCHVSIQCRLDIHQFGANGCQVSIVGALELMELLVEAGSQDDLLPQEVVGYTRQTGFYTAGEGGGGTGGGRLGGQKGGGGRRRQRHVSDKSRTTPKYRIVI
jgi:hypothetical protein